MYVWEHTYMIGNIHTWLETYIHTYMIWHLRHTYIHDCLGPPEVPPLTNLKKLNKTFNTEGFPWGIGPSPGMMIYGLKHTYMLGYTHTCLDTSGIHTCSQVSDIHTCIHANFAHPGVGSDSSWKTFSIWSPIQFFEICAGGTSGGLRHTYMHSIHTFLAEGF